ncbi:MAG TPA: hypothetical protein VMB34_03190 [Acetobacteraceae bacterium]|nr:hypothetical protein [Acetobacteraceae bacterium]
MQRIKMRCLIVLLLLCLPGACLARTANATLGVSAVVSGRCTAAVSMTGRGQVNCTAATSYTTSTDVPSDVTGRVITQDDVGLPDGSMARRITITY